MRWWKALNPIDNDMIEGERKTLRLRIALSIQLEELKAQLERLEAQVDPTEGSGEDGGL